MTETALRADLSLGLPFLGSPPSGGDDTASLRADLAAALAAGEPLILSGGTYLLSGRLVPTLSGAIRGMGKHLTTLKWADGAGTMPGADTQGNGSGLIHLDSVSSFDVTDLTIDCNAANNTGSTNGIYVTNLGGTNPSDLTFERLHIKDTEAVTPGEFGNGIRIVSAGERFTVRNCEFSGHSATTAMQFSAGPKRITVVENVVYGGCKNGIDFSTGEQITCSKNHIYDLLDVGGMNTAIMVTNASRVVMNDNVVSNCRNGIAGSGGTLVVQGNILEGASTAGGTAIAIENTIAGQFRTVGSNYINGFAVGVRLGGAEYSTVVGGVINNCPVGIDLTGSATGNEIDAVLIRLASTAAVRLGASTANNRVRVRAVDGSAAVSDSGTANTVS